MKSRIALASVVTEATLREFSVLRSSFERFHGNRYDWFVRCDTSSAQSLCSVAGISVSTFPDNDTGLEAMEHKMDAMEDAWSGSHPDAVAFLAPDLIFCDAALEFADGLTGQLILTLNHFPWKTLELSPFYGYFNTGFLFTRDSNFHEAWRLAVRSQPWKYKDQGSLNELAAQFAVSLMPRSANVGRWRYDQNDVLFNPRIPDDCLFFRTPLYRKLRTPEEWLDRIFGLQCLRFLESTGRQDHLELRNEILSRDESGWYQASISLFYHSTNKNNTST